MADAKWTPPNAVPIKKEFTNAAAGPPKPVPISRLELQKLESQRSKPAPAPPPPAPFKRNTAPNPQESADREARIKQIREGLAKQKGRGKEAFNKAR